VDYTREPIIETVITPKDGAKLVVRNSKTVGQEEYFVDALEVVTFGSAIFFRSTERPKAFLVPASDYEVLEVREARIVLKNVGVDRSIKIAGGREASLKAPKEQPEQKGESTAPLEPAEVRGDRRKDRRRQGRRRRGREEQASIAEGEDQPEMREPTLMAPVPAVETPPVYSALLTPPPLISETISRYKEQFKDAFYSRVEREESELAEQQEIPFNTSLPEVPLMPPAFGSFESSEEDEEEIYRQRKRRFLSEENLPEESAPFEPNEEKKPEEESPQV
jgi:hypothetical protein